MINQTQTVLLAHSSMCVPMAALPVLAHACAHSGATTSTYAAVPYIFCAEKRVMMNALFDKARLAFNPRLLPTPKQALHLILRASQL